MPQKFHKVDRATSRSWDASIAYKRFGRLKGAPIKTCTSSKVLSMQSMYEYAEHVLARRYIFGMQRNFGDRHTPRGHNEVYLCYQG